MAAADALGAAELNAEQLVALAGVAGNASPLELPLLFSAIERSKPLAPDIAKHWLRALKQSSGLESLRPEQIESVFQSQGDPLAHEAQALVHRLSLQSSEQAARLTELAHALVGGNAEKGKSIFFGKRTACFACHRVGDQGGIVGPDLSTIGKIRQRRDLTEAIVFPSASLARGYQTYAVALTNGEVVTGVLAKEASDAIFLRNTNREELRIERAEIDDLKPTPMSVMPQGLDKTMTTEELCDLLAYLESLQG